MVYLFKPVLTNDPYDIHGFWQDDTAYKQNYSNNNGNKKTDLARYISPGARNLMTIIIL